MAGARGGTELYDTSLPGSSVTRAYPSPVMAKPPTQTGTSSASVVRKGYVSVKEDGIRSWIWSKRWLVLRETTLLFHKNEVCIHGLLT